MKVSIIIPAYNEEKTISELLKRVKAVDLRRYGLEKEIIVVDDGSKDSTAEIAKNTQGIKLIRHLRNYGKGAAIRTAIKNVTGDIVIVQDADLEYNPEDYPKLLTPILEKKAKVVYGSRYLTKEQKQKCKEYLKEGKTYYQFYYGGRIVTSAANMLYGLNITDEATCYKVFKADLLKNLNLKCKGFEFCPEVTAKVAKKGYHIIEVPISYYPRSVKEGKKIKWKDGIEAITTLLKYRFTD